MNLKSWSKHHTYGLLIGIATTIVAIPIVMMILGAMDNQLFSTMWHKFKLSHAETSRIISLASIANLIWFHTFLRKGNYPIGMGIIAATAVNLLIILYFKFLA